MEILTFYFGVFFMLITLTSIAWYSYGTVSGVICLLLTLSWYLQCLIGEDRDHLKPKTEEEEDV